MRVKLLIQDKCKTIATLQTLSEVTTQRITHVRVANRGAITLGWDRLFAILVQALSGQNPSVWMPRLQQILTALSNIDGVHPDSISREDLNYLVANATAFGTVLARAGNGEIDPAILALLGKYKDLGDPYAPVDDPDPFYVETFFTKATQSISEGTYEGWWSPIEHENLPIGASGGAGKIELSGIQPDQDEEPTAEGKWAGIGIGHRLIYIGQDRVLDWSPSAKPSYRVWAYDRLADRSDPLTEVLLEGNWSTITKGHELIWLGRDLRGKPDSVDDLVLDWVPSTISEDYPAGYYRVFRVDPEGTKYKSTASDILAEPYLVKGNWTSIRANKKLVYLGGDRVLDWEPSSGNARIWILARKAVKNAVDNIDPFPGTPEVEWNWDSIQDDHRIINFGGDRVLSWMPSTGWYRVWRYDRTIRDGDPFPNPPLVEGYWQDIDETHELVWLGGRQILDWQPESSKYRILLFDRTEVSGNPLK